MTELKLSIGEPFTSPAWESNFVVFSSDAVIAEDHSKDYMRKVCKYAKSFGVYLVPERFYLMDYQCLCLVNPQGKVLGAQKGLFRNTSLHGGKHGTDLEVFHTEFGGVLLCVDVDIYHPEVARIAEGMGAQFIICSQTIREEDYSSSMVFTGAWNAAQSCNVFVANVANLYNCICAPLRLTKHGDGFLTSPSMRVPMTAKMSAESLRACKPPFRLSRKFYAVHRGDLTH